LFFAVHFFLALSCVKQRIKKHLTKSGTSGVIPAIEKERTHMKAIILAAGMGRRLSEASGGMPKSMITIGDTSIMHRQIQSCLDVGIKSFVFVLGYKRQQLQTHILQKLDASQCTFIENPIYGSTNTLYSLWLTREQFTEDFIYFNADVLFSHELLNKICAPSPHSQLLLETKSCGEEEVKMILEGDRIVEIGKQLPIPQCAGEFIGVGKFNKEVLPHFAKHLQYGVDTGQENNYFEYAVDLLSKDAYLQAVPTDGAPCIEIDFPEDLARALKMFG
jgi:choline kinase